MRIFRLVNKEGEVFNKIYKTIGYAKTGAKCKPWFFPNGGKIVEYEVLETPVSELKITSVNTASAGTRYRHIVISFENKKIEPIKTDALIQRT